ncbi:mitochondrial import inner membrane translocase subunit tim54 [Colletotrichum spaethianum]|uniref:Mitochondrial import inner membrane translocase subunit TIM54 n=1 Tax=Colletotrichum spaethianum TaxID=700344 RepID=A0AA37UQ70_9PEZI|nr:mitochondrial import inner membrane translocase subunit tim54 [Colletotrichum spaethianum]GKT48227.1 mitochondrial import inner membrane translocase subunit tim54 [Colletotrichum spaethianum]
MADSKPTPPEAAAAPKPTPSAPASAAEGYKAAKPNPVWQMMGLRGPPKRLPSRNWMIFLSVTGAISAAIIYDKREKNRATARWARAVAPLAQEPIGHPSQLPRKLTVLLEAPPGDGLRVAQDHFLEYIKPILAASGLDWEFVQGRQQGDVRAAVAEKIRRRRSREERPDVELLLTEENIRDAMRQKNGIPEYEGPAGDIVIGRHTWKEYPEEPPKPETAQMTEGPETTAAEGAAAAAGTEEKKDEEPPKEEKKSDRPPQPVPHNTPLDYPTSHLPLHIPAEFSPSDAIPFPHLLGFAGTFTRMQRFLNRRRLADDIGRQVAAACFAASREWREEPSEHPDQPYEQQRALEHEEHNWVKSVWKEAAEAPESADEAERTKERIWTSPVVIDPRIATRMRRFEIRPEDEERARQIVVPEEEVEGWIKGSLRALGRWGWDAVRGDQRKGPNVGDIDE